VLEKQMRSLSDIVGHHKPLKHGHYWRFYEQFLEPHRQRIHSVLEIGVQNGGSLRTWEEYFPNARVVGVDTDAGCAVHSAGRVEVLIGDQENAAWLRAAVIPHGPFDLIVDDGGHTMRQQITSLRTLWGPGLARGGWYVIEDLHTSYWDQFGGGLRRAGATMEFLKALTDQVNVHFHQEPDSEFPGVLGLHFYDSLCFLEKKEQF
jgi:hypothetical protein